MNIGDRVRLLHDTQEGIITNFLPDNLVEIEIEEGFKIPVLRQEVVPIAKEEKIVFRERHKEEPVSAPVVSAEMGFFLAFLPINDRQLSVYLINNTDIDILFNLGEVRDTNYYGLAAGYLTKRSSQKVTEANLDKFEKWSPLLIQAIFFKPGFTSLKEPLIRKFTFSASSFFKSKSKAPLLDKDCHLFQIDQKIVSINPEQIKESITERQVATAPVNVSASLAKHIAPAAMPKQPRQMEIDLHIEQLTKDYNKMNAAQMLEIQLKAFETALDKAILEAYDEIIFIHGVGNGTLRHEIHKRLSKHPHIAYYKDARKEKFGYGATQAKIK
ncbi:MAG: DUF2027 domain-containing protein [Cytophagales bacterium]|nr:DUF2027 domain-containing protein [Bernardetiaceae bacterium]MDW8204741.1 DUF2027 domain-containing protein [Cytophagales bacterium]